MIVRENTEGMYIADEESYTDDGAIARRIITKEAEKRIINYAFKFAKENNKTNDNSKTNSYTNDYQEEVEDNKTLKR